MSLYIYSIINDFPEKIVAIDSLENSIRSSDITVAFDYPKLTNVNCELKFKTDLSSEEKIILDNIVAAHDGMPLDPDTIELTDDNVIRTSVEPTEGSRHTAVTPNWCDKTTWYYSAERTIGLQLDDYGDHQTYTGSGSWVDNFHGKYSNEDYLKTSDGHIPRLKVYVDGYEKNEQDPHFNTGGDYTVDYRNASITFLTALSPSSVVTADVYKVTDSEWILQPEPGKKLKIVSSEVQFSRDISLTDSVVFQAYGLVDVFAPHLVPSILPSGTMIPLGRADIYKTMMDYINGANGAYPIIEKGSESNPSWRDLQEDVFTFPWNYQAVTNLNSSYGMEVRIKLAHDAELKGQNATATFYCLSCDL